MDLLNVGLDAYNAYNVVETLSRLSKTHGTCVIMSIHQPRSDIFALFDKLILLSAGSMLYSGPSARVLDYFDQLGFQPAADYNTADFLGEC